MIEKQTVESHVREILRETGIFLVEVRIGSNNRIRVFVDRNEGISIDDCARVNRALEAKLDRDREDFSLEVSSPGLDAAFKVPQQYSKNKGKRVAVECRDGNKYLGILREVQHDRILLEIPSGRRGEDPALQELVLKEIVSTKIHIEF